MYLNNLTLLISLHLHFSNLLFGLRKLITQLRNLILSIRIRISKIIVDFASAILIIQIWVAHLLQLLFLSKVPLNNWLLRA